MDISNKIQQVKVLTPTSKLRLDRVQIQKLLAVNDNVEPCETTFTESASPALFLATGG